MCLSLLRFVALTFLFVTDLRAKETSHDCAKGECSYKPNAKTHNCDGA